MQTGYLSLKFPWAPCPQSHVLSTNQQALPPYLPPWTPSSLFSWAAVQNPFLLVFLPLGPNPHFMYSQQFCNLPIAKYPQYSLVQQEGNGCPGAA